MKAGRDEWAARPAGGQHEFVAWLDRAFGLGQHLQAEVGGYSGEIDLLIERLKHQDELRISSLN